MTDENKTEENKVEDLKTDTPLSVEDREKILQEEMKLMNKLAAILEARNIEEFIDLRKRPWKLIFWNLVIGLFRGIGFFFGATVVGVVLVALGTTFFKEHFAEIGGLPWIGGMIADLVIHVQQIIEQSGVSNGK